MHPLQPHDWPNDNGRALPPGKLNTSFLCGQVDFQARGLYSEMAESSGLALSELIVLVCVYLCSAKFCTSFKVVAAILEGEQKLRETKCLHAKNCCKCRGTVRFATFTVECCPNSMYNANIVAES